MFQSKAMVQIGLFLLIVAFGINCAFSAEVEVGNYKITYSEPNNVIAINQNLPNTLGAWKNPNSGDAIMILAYQFPNGLDIDESGVIEGVEKETGAKIQNFKDFQARHLLFREGTASVPGLNIMLYFSYWWTDGVFIKLQGTYTESNASPSIAAFRTILAGINVSSKDSSAVQRGENKIHFDSHEISKKLGGIGFLVLLAIGVYSISKRQKPKSKDAVSENKSI